MNIYLGNLSINDIERRTGVSFPQELCNYMQDRHQAVAENVAEGKWHCFDMPFVLVCGGMPVAQEIANHLQPLSSEFKEPLQIALSNTGSK